MGDKLPKIYDVGISIFSVATKVGSEKMNACINAYVTCLLDMWTKAFGDKHVLNRRKTTKKQVECIVNHYNSHVYIEQFRSKPKKKSACFVKKTVRQLNREWRGKSISFKKNPVKIDSLFDIGIEMEKVTGNEKVFYEDQKGNQIYRLSEEIDTQYVIEQQQEEEERQGLLRREEAEVRFSEMTDAPDDGTELLETSVNSELNTSVNRSGIKRVATEDIAVQFDSFPKKKIRLTRNCTPESKAACVALSVNCQLSTEMSRVAFQTVCSKQYGHEYYLSAEEAIKKDPSLQKFKPPLEVESTSINSRQAKQKRTIPISKDDYEVYQNVIPSARSLNDYKQVLAIQHEREAAIALNEITPNMKVTLHFDATSRSKIDGDWPCLILIFSNKRRFSLRPLFFAYEDRAQIIRLIVETYQRLAAAIDNSSVTAKTLWEKTTALMTDSVKKNLHIGEGAAKTLQSNHVPLHLLCKSHPVEAFDRSNLAVLSNIENSLGFRKSLETLNPAVRSFLRGKSVVECAINSILTLVSHDKSATSTNQADLFDHILEREGQVKHIAMYYERRFTKLGYSAASILEALPYLRMLLDETHLSNQHVEIVRMFLDSEFLITELQTLAYFTHTITLPFLYFVEVNSQEELLKMFPLLYNDLNEGKMDTLKDYIVVYPHVKVHTPTEDVAFKILKMMCVDAAIVFGRQAGREYGFGTLLNEPARATQLYLLSKEELSDLSTNNLDAERHLTVFGRRAPLAKYRNKKFTAKGIRNDCTLYHSETFHNEPSKSFSVIVKLLNSMEKDWVGEQKELHKLKMLEKIEKGRKQMTFVDSNLQLCKGWGGPAISVEELMAILKKYSDKKEKIVKTELCYYRDTHKSQIISNPDLFRINKVTYDEQLLNLCTLLAGKDPMSEYATLPTNKDAEKLLSSSKGTSTEDNDEDDEDDIVVNRNYITLITEGNINTWYIATCVEMCDDKRYKMDFLHRVDKTSHLLWKHPTRPDTDILSKGSILACTIDGDWDVTLERNMTYRLKNHEYIEKLVLGLM